ncbi:MAG: alanyl-tRNA editing protein [Proteobacteria bacterium]|jgi:misacylated tRNA(Ala) deacylase|nr:alanyl-tRNA editing protein [Pseudomonadota bacterium]MDA1301619.1 alanyl-tRNA editing protein [Pseudomonadota bacterium]
MAPTVTHASYYDDAYTTRLTTEIVGIEGASIVLANTIFYPTGGGQPGDTGQLTTNDGRTMTIIDTVKSRDTGEITHEVESPGHGLTMGSTVQIELDWDRRYRHMRMHTAMHLLGSLIPAPVTGGQVGSEKSRLDFDVGDQQLDKEQLTASLNALISTGHELVISAITDAELDANPELVRTMSVQPPRGSGTIRMIQIPGVDYQPCGGTHVRNTAEIGEVRVSKIENKGRQNRRVHLIFA